MRAAADAQIEADWPVPAPPGGRSLAGRVWAWRGRPLLFEESARFGTGELAARLFAARGAAPEDMPRLLHPTLRDWMPDPSHFPDMDRAADRIADAVRRGETVAVFTDYDVDGATSGALVLRHLRALGLAPRPYVPDRLLEGYGPTAQALAGLRREGATLAILLDCGTQAFAALEAARALGLDVVVVDHHRAGAALPPACALVNPSRLDAGPVAAAHAHLCTAGLAFLLAAAVNRALRRTGHFAAAPEPRIQEWLDLVALGTVADMVPLSGLNRAFVALGLRRLAAAPNAGVAALLRLAGRAGPPSVRDLGFLAGPRINAGGRIGAADLGLRLLASDDPGLLEELAARLDRLNAERRAIEAQVTEEAVAQARARGALPVAVAAGRGWHPGVVGIAAARLKEQLGVPAVVIGLAGDGLGRGSGRSIAGVDLGGAVLAAREAGLLEAGGGHAMAAGLTIREERIGAFAEFLIARLGARVTAAREAERLWLDLSVAPCGLDLALAEGLEAAGPYGEGWPPPRVVVGPVEVLEARAVGDGGHVRIRAAGADGAHVSAVAFRQADTPLGAGLVAGRGRRFWLAGAVAVDRWNGRSRAELHLDDAVPAA